jgi:hypothetical protein
VLIEIVGVLFERQRHDLSLVSEAATMGLFVKASN